MAGRTARADVSAFSEVYQVRRLREADAEDILFLCRQNGLYYHYCPPFATRQSILDDMRALPPGKDASDKYYVGYYEGRRLVAVLDLILGFPDEKTALLGFFMTEVSVQNTGVGSRIVGELCRWLTGAGFWAVQLGWVRGNPQAEHFWQKNGFTATGAAHDTGRSVIVTARRALHKP